MGGIKLVGDETFLGGGAGGGFVFKKNAAIQRFRAGDEVVRSAADQAEFVDQVTGGHDFNLDDIVVGAEVTAHRILRYTRLRPIRAGATVGPEK